MAVEVVPNNAEGDSSMGDSDGLSADVMLRLQRLAHHLHRRYQKAYGWYDFDPDDVFQETVKRILEITRPADEGRGLVKVSDGEPVNIGFYIIVMRYVMREMINRSRLARKSETIADEGDGMEDEVKQIRDRAPLPDEKAEIEELRRKILEECNKRYGDPDFTEVVRKVLYEGCTFNGAFKETDQEKNEKLKPRRAAYFRRFSKIIESLIKKYTKH